MQQAAVNVAEPLVNAASSLFICKYSDLFVLKRMCSINISKVLITKNVMAIIIIVITFVGSEGGAIRHSVNFVIFV